MKKLLKWQILDRNLHVVTCLKLSVLLFGKFLWTDLRSFLFWDKFSISLLKSPISPTIPKRQQLINLPRRDFTPQKSNLNARAMSFIRALSKISWKISKSNACEHLNLNSLLAFSYFIRANHSAIPFRPTISNIFHLRFYIYFWNMQLFVCRSRSLALKLNLNFNKSQAQQPIQQKEIKTREF